jgi:uncharacterized membrane protein YdjX (TVP38/TMEM64 family)
MTGATPSRPTRPLAIGAGLGGFFLVGFLAAEAFDVPWLSAPPSFHPWSAAAAATVSVGLLVADAVLPVPASLIIFTLGGLFGPVTGATLAIVGRAGCTLLGFALGRCLTGRMPAPDDDRAARLLRRWGAFAIVLTRPIPILAETVAVLAGASRMSWTRAGLAAVAGSLPEAMLFAWAGARADGTALGAALWLALIALAALVWLGGHLLDRARNARAE